MEFDLTVIKIGIVLFVLMVLVVLKSRTIGSREKDFPPGPKTTPFVGNALDFPTSFPHVKFSEWAREYGEIFSLKVFNQTFIVVSSATAIKSILDMNGASTGNRLGSTVMQRVTSGQFLPLVDMDTRVWRHDRKAMHTFLNKERLERHLQMQHVEHSQYLRDILEDPKNLFQHVGRTTVSVMTTLLYGFRTSKYEGSYAQTFFNVVKLLNATSDPRAYPPVDFFWPLQYVPKRWAYWKRFADSTRRIRNEFYESLYEQCERAIGHDKQTECYVESLILNQHELGMARGNIIHRAGMMMEAGGETTASFLQSLILTLINNPRAQEKGQQEVDKVIGPDRWPVLEDYDSLPYVRAIVDETFRLRTILPIALPHASTKVLYYKGFRIPEGAVIFMNIYGMFNNPDMYEDPEEFQPERFLRTPFGLKEGADAKDYRYNFAFGAGLRVCPGEGMARRTIAMNAMNLLWAFNFEKDDSGTGSQDWDSYAQPGLELAPKPFTCNSTPRSAAKAQMIRDRYSKQFPTGTDGTKVL